MRDALYQLKCCSRVPLHAVLNLVKRKNLIATWHWCQLDHNCDYQISTSVRVKCWWHRVFSRQRTVMDADHRDGWTQIFGGKGSEQGDFWTVYTTPNLPKHLHLAPPWGWFHRNFIDNRGIFGIKNLFGITQACDRKTYGHPMTANIA